MSYGLGSKYGLPRRFTLDSLLVEVIVLEDLREFVRVYLFADLRFVDCEEKLKVSEYDSGVLALIHVELHVSVGVEVVYITKIFNHL